MIYLVLDTNIWIYLANGFDTKSGKYHDNNHFILLHKLMDLSADGDICVLVNDLIIEEWLRNKKNAEMKIIQLQSKMQNIAPIKEISKYVKTNLSAIKSEYIEGLKEDIKANQVHLALLEKFLFNDCQLIPLPDAIKLKVFNLSTQKRAPFHNNKNNNADAAILFSTPSFFENHFWNYGDSVMFISNNIEEYTDGKNETEFHPHIIEELNGFDLKYFKRLPEALEISEDIIKDIDSYNQNKIIEVPPTDCMMSFCRYEDLILDCDLRVVYEIDLNTPSNQLCLFPQMFKKTRRSYVQSVYCPACETLHYQCPKCFEVSCVNDGPIFCCTSCKSPMSMRDNKHGEWELMVYINNRPVEEIEKEYYELENE
jgi:predicted nucleic acid-binding protein